MGSLADRFGARAVLALSIAAWSLVTLSTGFAQSFVALVAIRLMLGVTESGAYPAAAGLIKNWARPEERGRFSSWVALGGRIRRRGRAVVDRGPRGRARSASASRRWHNPSGVNWRGVFVLYGLCGLVVAVLFWLIVRNRPAESVAPTVGSGGAEDWHALPAVAAQAGADVSPEARAVGPDTQHVALRRDAVLREHRLGLHHHAPPHLPKPAVRSAAGGARADAVDGARDRLLRDVLRRVRDGHVPGLAWSAAAGDRSRWPRPWPDARWPSS